MPTSSRHFLNDKNYIITILTKKLLFCSLSILASAVTPLSSERGLRQFFHFQKTVIRRKYKYKRDDGRDDGRHGPLHFNTKQEAHADISVLKSIISICHFLAVFSSSLLQQKIKFSTLKGCRLTPFCYLCRHDCRLLGKPFISFLIVRLQLFLFNTAAVFQLRLPKRVVFKRPRTCFVNCHRAKSQNLFAHLGQP